MLDWMVELQVVSGALPIGAILGAEEAVRCHAAIAPDEELADLSIGELIGFVVDRHREHTAVADWEGVRLQAVAGVLPVGSCDPHLARRLDAAAFGRHLSTTLPRSEPLVKTLLGRLHHDAQRIVGAVMTDLVLVGRWNRLGAVVDSLDASRPDRQSDHP